MLEQWQRSREARRERVDHWVQRAGIPAAYSRVREGAGNAVGASADAVRQVGLAIASPVIQAMRATPLAAIFTSDPARQAERERDTMVQRAEIQSRKFTGDIATNR